MRITSIAATAVSLFFHSRSAHVSIGKLALIGMLVTAFFLFTSGYHFPGGASHYPNWAEAIVNGTKLPFDVTQREVGFPLLYILGDFPFTHSFIGITLILAMFAMLISVLVYLCLAAVSPEMAFYTGLACILTLSPFTYLKFFYPDEAYMFFNLLAATLLVRFIQSKNSYRLLYFFTITALAASFTRTAGNLMFPMLLVIAYIMVRGSLRHYLACALIFALGTGLYQWHRYDIFDMRHQPKSASTKGFQMLYPNYLYLRDFGLRLSPDFGPNTKRILEKLRQDVGMNVRDSVLIRNSLGETPSKFMEKNLYAYTPDQLVEKIAVEPNEEYYYVLLGVAENDQMLLDVAKEIMWSNPWYVIRYTMRNFRHALFDPGFASTRYNTLGYGHTGNEFMPATQGYGVRSEDPVTQYGARAVNEMKYFPLETTPWAIQKIFAIVNHSYYIFFDKYVWITSILIIIAWISASLAMFSRLFSQRKLSQIMYKLNIDMLIAPIIVASALVVYEDLLTSLFCQPVYRYFHLTEPLRLVIAGCGAVLVTRIILLWKTQDGTNPFQPVNNVAAAIRERDLIDKYFGHRPRQWIIFLIIFNVVLFGWWVLSMLAHT